MEYYENGKINEKQLSGILEGSEKDKSYIKQQGKVQKDSGSSGGITEQTQPAGISNGGMDTNSIEGEGGINETHRDSLLKQRRSKKNNSKPQETIPAGDVGGTGNRGNTGRNDKTSSGQDIRGDESGNKEPDAEQQSDKPDGNEHSLGDSQTNVDNVGVRGESETKRGGQSSKPELSESF